MWKAYLKTHRSFIAIWGLCIGLVAFMMRYIRLTVLDIFYLLCWLIVPVLIYSMVRFFKQFRFYKTTQRRLQELDKPYLLYEVLPEAKTFDTEQMAMIVQKMTESASEQLRLKQKDQEDYYQYIQLWIHEIKLPLASLQLMIDNHHFDTLALQRVSHTMDDLVEQALFYAKSNQVAHDYHIKKQSSLEIMNTVVASFAPDFIQTKTQIIMPEQDATVLSDKQWVGFILKQLIANSLKYRASHQPKVVLRIKETAEGVYWYIQDNGMGISSIDLPYVFEKGYTGQQGRSDKKATGMGLYLCHTLSQQLNISLKIHSVEGEGTEVILFFPYHLTIYND